VSTPQRLVIAVAAACLVAGCAAGAAPPHAPVAAETSSAAPPTQQLSGPQPIPGKAVVTPIRVAIPAIGVRQSALEALTRDPGTGELRPPVDFDRIGYYVAGPAPGDPGPAVLAGHVDDTTGPKVFFRLRELKAGDQVTVTRSTAGTCSSAWTRWSSTPRTRFPPTPSTVRRQAVRCGSSPAGAPLMPPPAPTGTTSWSTPALRLDGMPAPVHRTPGSPSLPVGAVAVRGNSGTATTTQRDSVAVTWHQFALTVEQLRRPRHSVTETVPVGRVASVSSL